MHIKAFKYHRFNILHGHTDIRMQIDSHSAEVDSAVIKTIHIQQFQTKKFTFLRYVRLNIF